MISLDRTSNSDHHFTNPTTINFECNDVKRYTGLLLLKQKNNDNNDKNKFELHLYNDYTNQAIAMILDTKGFRKMFEALDEYFEKGE